MAGKTEDLDKVRERLDAKRAKLADLEVQRVVNTQQHADDLERATLAAEEARLDAEIERAQELASPAHLKAGNENNLTATKAALAAAQGQPFEVPADAVPDPDSAADTTATPAATTTRKAR